MSIKLQLIRDARQQIGEAWSKLEEARQTLERLGVETEELQTKQGELYRMAMKLDREAEAA